MLNDCCNDGPDFIGPCNGDHEDGETRYRSWRGDLQHGRRVCMDQEIDLIAVQLVEEVRMDLNDIPYADEYKRKAQP